MKNTNEFVKRDNWSPNPRTQCQLSLYILKTFFRVKQWPVGIFNSISGFRVWLSRIGSRKCQTSWHQTKVTDKDIFLNNYRTRFWGQLISLSTWGRPSIKYIFFCMQDTIFQLLLPMCKIHKILVGCLGNDFAIVIDTQPLSSAW